MTRVRRNLRDAANAMLDARIRLQRLLGLLTMYSRNPMIAALVRVLRDVESDVVSASRALEAAMAPGVGGRAAAA